MNSRDKILKRLTKASGNNAASIPVLLPDIQIFSDYPDKENLIEIFAKRFESLHGELHIVESLQDAANTLENKILQSINEKCITFNTPLINKILKLNPDISNQFDISKSDKIDSRVFAEYAVSLTTADFLIARTGSIVINSLNHGGRRISVLPPVHIVVAQKNQIVKSLDDIFSDDYIAAGWSYATIISGPSRTSDIEKQLVLGAHGPKRLIVILIENQ